MPAAASALASSPTALREWSWVPLHAMLGPVTQKPADMPQTYT